TVVSAQACRHARPFPAGSRSPAALAGARCRSRGLLSAAAQGKSIRVIGLNTCTVIPRRSTIFMWRRKRMTRENMTSQRQTLHVAREIGRTLHGQRHWVLAAVFACAGMVSVHAAPQYCGGTLTNLIVYSNGDLVANFSWRADYVRICNMNGTMGQ